MELSIAATAEDCGQLVLIFAWAAEVLRRSLSRLATLAKYAVRNAQTV